MFVRKGFFEKCSPKCKNIVAIQKAIFWGICKVAGMSLFIVFTRNALISSLNFESFYVFLWVCFSRRLSDGFRPSSANSKTCQDDFLRSILDGMCYTLCSISILNFEQLSFQTFLRRLRNSCFAVIQCWTGILVSWIAFEKWYCLNLAWKLFF